MKFQPVDHLDVFLTFDAKPTLVGRLVSADRQIHFQYNPEFLSSNIDISPLILKRTLDIQTADPSLFEGLFGVFNDSLPDGWGRLLLDRQMRQLGTAHQSLSPLDRLAYVGDRGMGALCYQPAISVDEDVGHVNLDELAQSSQVVLAGGSDEFFNELLTLNGSSSGARPKIVAQVSDDFATIQSNARSLAPGFSSWLIKFANSQESIDAGRVEYAYSLMARDAGIEMPRTHLFETDAGAYFACERFDRDGDRRLHVHSLSGLVGADHRIPSLDYEMALRATKMLTRNHKEVAKHFRLAVFNVLAHNRDDHVKNFAYLMNEQGHWRLAPGYDLTYSFGPAGEQSMMVCGEGRNPGRENLLTLANCADVQNAKEIIDEVSDALSKWPSYAANAGVAEESLNIISNSLNAIK